MKLYKTNAYPDVDLHDCHFKIFSQDDVVLFDFPNGFSVLQNGEWKCIKGQIRIAACSIDELSILSKVRVNVFGIHRGISRYLSEKDLNKIFKEGVLELFDEYYACERFLWKCAIYPYDKCKKLSRKYGEIEIGGYIESPLEYYLDDEISVL